MCPCALPHLASVQRELLGGNEVNSPWTADHTGAEFRVMLNPNPAAPLPRRVRVHPRKAGLLHRHAAPTLRRRAPRLHYRPPRQQGGLQALAQRARRVGPHLPRGPTTRAPLAASRFASRCTSGTGATPPSSARSWGGPSPRREHVGGGFAPPAAAELSPEPGGEKRRPPPLPQRFLW